MNNLTFADLIDIDSLQMVQNSFSKFTGMAFCVYDAKGTPVVKSSGYTNYCKNINQSTTQGLERCNQFDRNGILKAFSEGKVVIQKCHAGLISIIVPISFDGRIIGAIIAGQVHSDDFDIEELSKNAVGLGIKTEDYIKAADETTYIPDEHIQKIAVFLSEFSNALSVMAYSNFKKIRSSRKMERSARSQSNLITGMTKELSETMREWLDDFRAATGKYENVPEIRYETDALLAKGQEVYAVIDGAVDFIRVSGGDVEYSESIYHIRRLVQQCMKPLERMADKNKVSIRCEFDDKLPEKLVGNSGRIGQVIGKLSSNIISTTREGGELIFSASCVNTTYSCTLIIELTGKDTLIDEKSYEKYQKIINSGGADIFNNEKNIKSNSFDLPLIFLLVKQMSGNIQMSGQADKSIKFTITIPQLDGSENDE